MPIYAKNTEKRLPATFTLFQGGLFLDVFYPGPPINSSSSDLYGNKNTGNPITYKSYSDGIGTKSGSWAIIICPIDYDPSQYSAFKTNTNENFNTSSYDGLYNFNTKIKYYSQMKLNFKYGNYTDWYVPSVDELAFISKNLPLGYYIPRDFSAFESTVYRSSTVSLQNTSLFFYGQSFSKDKYGTVIHVPAESGSTKVRPIRRIEIL